MAHTPKEKAKELFGKMRVNSNPILTVQAKDAMAKQCALIAVGFAINAIKDCSVVAGYPLEVSEDWREDCIKFYGEVLTGKNAHWCPDWDFLPIDDTCKEIECCTCGTFNEMEIKNKIYGTK